MPITAEAFLEALDLPSEHPYLPPQENNLPEEKEWSISSYFSSVAWAKDEIQTTSVESDECGVLGYFATPSWAKRLSSGQHDTVEDGCHRSIHSSSVPISNSNAVDFLEEIKPCLVSMFHMNIIIWAPLVLLFCLKKLYNAPKYCPSEYPPKQIEPKCSDASSSKQEKPSLPMSSLFFGIPSLPKLHKGTQKRRTSEPNNQNNNSFERLLLLLSLFVSVMGSFPAIFPVEGKEEEPKKLEVDAPKGNTNDHLDKRNRARSESNASLLSQGPFVITGEWLAYVVALVCTAVAFCDAMYVLDYKQNNLLALHLFVISISLKRFGSKLALATALPITTVSLYIMSHQDLELPMIEPGLYYDKSNPLIYKTVNKWPVDKRTYDDGRGTPWMVTGDTRTGLPFMVNSIPKQKFVRRWVPLPGENEAVILDIAFPDSMVVEDDKRVYLLLHGINGDSNEGYIVDFVHRIVSQGNIAAVMVTRGLGDSTIIGENILHFARISDVTAAAKVLKKAIRQVSPEHDMLLAGVGYSMGAITLANYVSQVNPPDLDVAIAFSGSLDTKEQPNFRRSAYLWQPFIAKAMRDTLMGRYSKQIIDKLSEEQLKEVMAARNMVEFDKALFVAYNGFESSDHYYSEMGALSDFDRNGYEGRISEVSIPLLCVHSLDDPISYHKSLHDPREVSKSGNGNTMLLITRKGGHVGWPLGWNPAAHGWSWMAGVASSFAESVDWVRRNQ